MARFALSSILRSSSKSDSAQAEAGSSNSTSHNPLSALKSIPSRLANEILKPSLENPGKRHSVSTSQSTLSMYDLPSHVSQPFHYCPESQSYVPRKNPQDLWSDPPEEQLHSFHSEDSSSTESTGTQLRRQKRVKRDSLPSERLRGRAQSLDLTNSASFRGEKPRSGLRSHTMPNIGAGRDDLRLPPVTVTDENPPVAPLNIVKTRLAGSARPLSGDGQIQCDHKPPSRWNW